MWESVGSFETPKNIVNEFSEFVINKYVKCNCTKIKKGQTSILDLFAGDGRLGIKLISDLAPYINSTMMTFVEFDESKTKLIKPEVKYYEIFKENVFAWEPGKKFDLVITNPPYQLLNVKNSEQYGFSWKMAKKFCRNLYALGIIKGLDLCHQEGVLAFIGPFSWLRNYYSSDFRKELATLCSNISIKAYNHRRVFMDTSQDIAFQYFQKRKKGNDNPCTIEFTYNETNPIRLDLSEPKIIAKNTLNNSSIRVGPIVWNRRKKNLVSKKNVESIPLIYGGNIRTGNNLDLEIPRYHNKQYIKKAGLSQSELSRSPMILIRRTLRGYPGKWKIDSCVIDKKNLICTIENHVIVIELPKNYEHCYKLNNNLLDELYEHYNITGSPNISTIIVKNIVERII